MPYKVYQDKGKWCVKNTETGERKGCSDTKQLAISQLRVLNAVKHGWTPTGKK